MDDISVVCFVLTIQSASSTLYRCIDGTAPQSINWILTLTLSHLHQNLIRPLYQEIRQAQREVSNLSQIF